MSDAKIIDPKEPETYPIPPGIHKSLVKLHESVLNLQRQLGMARATYLETEASIVAQLRAAQAEFARASQNALLSADVGTEGSWTVDLKSATMTRRGD